jgi:hypothetical protein
MLAVSSDRGTHWDLHHDASNQEGLPAVPVPASFNLGQAPPGLGSVNWTHVTVGREGDVYVSMFNFDAFEVYHSTNGGQSFTPPDASNGIGFPFGADQDISPASTRSLPNNRFRTQVVRAIAADPLRPGHVYASEAVKAFDAVGNVLDAADILFARSADYGRSWQTTTTIHGVNARVINDDNDGQRAKGLTDDVVSGQAQPRLSVDKAGKIALVWYDTRRDPANHLLDVFASVSTDGGASFSPNFRLTGDSFDADRGRFTDALGNDNYYIGDFLGLVLADDRAYAAWADTSSGSQDVRLARFSLSELPLPPNDRLEPNNTAATATPLGQVNARDFAKLNIAPGDEDWFALKTIATGSLVVSIAADHAGPQPQVELWDGAGQSRLAKGQLNQGMGGLAIEERITIAARSGQSYLVRVLPGDSEQRYRLKVQSLSADLGAHVYGHITGTVSAGDETYYALTVPAAGSLEVRVQTTTSADESLKLELLDMRTLAVLATASAVQGAGGLLTGLLPVEAGRQVLLHVSSTALVPVSFRLEFTNFDAFENLGAKVLRFPVGEGASQASLADVNGDGAVDVIVSDALADALDVLLGNGNGTFQAPAEFRVGASPGNLGIDLELPTYRRDLIVADLNHDGRADTITANYSASDVSVLLGRGDGTLQAQRRSNATATPYALALGDLDEDGTADLVVHDSARSTDAATIAILPGRSGGRFRPERISRSPISSNSQWPDIDLGDVNGDRHLDLAVVGDLEANGGAVLLGDGHGGFSAGPRLPLVGFQVILADLDGDGKLDAITVNKYDNTIQYALGRGDGSFGDAATSPAGQSPIAIALADVAGPVDDAGVPGPPDGHLDVIVGNSGVAQPSFAGPATIVVLPSLVQDGAFAGFGSPVKLADAQAPQDVDVQDVNGDGVLDVLAVDSGDLVVVFGRPPQIANNDTPLSARDLGTVFHLIEPTETIVPSHADDYFSFTVPREAAHGAGDQIIDISAQFMFEDGRGLAMEVLDAAGDVRGSGQRVQLTAAQGENLLIHIFGRQAADTVRGTGTFTLVIDVLPQVIDVSAEALLPGVEARPGGPTTIIVLTVQGDRLDPTTAEDPANYAVYFLGDDGLPGTTDDVPLVIHSVIYNADSNVEISSGQTIPTSTAQTVTLLFDQALPPGSYMINVSANVHARAFNSAEASLLADRASLGVHPLVSQVSGTVVAGKVIIADGLVREPGSLGDLGVFETGTRFLTQFHSDLSALADEILKRLSDGPVTEAVLRDILARIVPGLGLHGARPTNLLILFLDPLPFGLVDPNGQRTVYDMNSDSLTRSMPKTYVEVGSNVEVVVVGGAQGIYRLNVADVPERARGAAVLLGNAFQQAIPLTAAIRTGERSFTFNFGGVSNIAPLNGSLPGTAAAILALPSAGTAKTDGIVAGPLFLPPNRGSDVPGDVQSPGRAAPMSIFDRDVGSGSSELPNEQTIPRDWSDFLSLLQRLLVQFWRSLKLIADGS